MAVENDASTAGSAGTVPVLFGDYEWLEPIGRGATGAVWRAVLFSVVNTAETRQTRRSEGGGNVTLTEAQRVEALGKPLVPF